MSRDGQYGYDNSYMLDMTQKYSGTFSGVAVIDRDDRPRERMRATDGPWQVMGGHTYRDSIDLIRGR